MIFVSPPKKFMMRHSSVTISVRLLLSARVTVTCKTYNEIIFQSSAYHRLAMTMHQQSMNGRVGGS